MKEWQLFIVEMTKQGREYLQLLIPVVMALLAPSPLGRKKDDQ